MGVESLKFSRWFRQLYTFFKVKTSGKPEYLLKLIPTGQHCYNIRSLGQIETYCCRTDNFKNSFFPYKRVEWNKLDFHLIEIRKSKSYAIFWNALLKIGQPNQCSVYIIHNPMGLKLFARLRLDLSHLNEDRLNHNFQSCINPLCICILATESTTYFNCTAIISQIFAQLF